MPSITRFGGIIPRKSWHLLQDNEATVAHDVKLRNGRLEAWREKRVIGQGEPGAVTLHYHGCCPLTWDTCVAVTDFLPDYGRLFLTGRIDRPETAIVKDCQPYYYYLGVPSPQSAVYINGSEEYHRDCAQRAYVYTYVNVFGEESAPSPVSNVLTIRDGHSVVVSGFSTPPDGYGIEYIRLYRAASGPADFTRKEHSIVTDFLLVDILPVGIVTYTDNVKEKALGPVCTTREVRLPPSDLRHLRHVSGTGVLVGVTDNMVHFSQAYLPYNWPAEYDITLPHNIVNMVTVGSKVFISTDGYPYVLEGAPDCEPRRCRALADGDTPLPDISCGYAHSAIGTPFGMVYSSKDGLVLVDDNAGFQIITSAWFSTDDWIKIKPDTARLAYWRGYLLCVTDTVSFMLEIDSGKYNDAAEGSLVTISDTPVDMVTTDSGVLVFLEQDQSITQWDGGNALRPYIWESAELGFSGTNIPITAKVRTNDITFRLLTPVPNLYYERHITDEYPFRIARLGRHPSYRIGLYGTGTVDFALLEFMNIELHGGIQ